MCYCIKYSKLIRKISSNKTKSSTFITQQNMAKSKKNLVELKVRIPFIPDTHSGSFRTPVPDRRTPIPGFRTLCQRKRSIVGCYFSVLFSVFFLVVICKQWVFCIGARRLGLEYWLELLWPWAEREWDFHLVGAQSTGVNNSVDLS